MLGQINSTPRSVLSRTGVTWRVWRKRKDSKIRKSCTYDNLSFLFHSPGGGFQTFLLTLLQDALAIWWTRNGMLKRGFLLVASSSMSRALADVVPSHRIERFGHSLFSSKVDMASAQNCSTSKFGSSIEAILDKNRTSQPDRVLGENTLFLFGLGETANIPKHFMRLKGFPQTWEQNMSSLVGTCQTTRS